MAEAVDVYCTGMEACQASRTTYGVAGIITPRYAANSESTPFEYDMAVIKTGDALPGAAVPLAQVGEKASACHRIESSCISAVTMTVGFRPVRPSQV